MHVARLPVSRTPSPARRRMLAAATSRSSSGDIPVTLEPLRYCETRQSGAPCFLPAASGQGQRVLAPVGQALGWPGPLGQKSGSSSSRGGAAPWHPHFRSTRKGNIMEHEESPPMVVVMGGHCPHTSEVRAQGSNGLVSSGDRLRCGTLSRGGSMPRTECLISRSPIFYTPRSHSSPDNTRGPADRPDRK